MPWRQQHPPDHDGQQFHRGDDHQDDADDTERPGIDQAAQGVLQREADAAGSDEAQHHRHPQVDVDAVDERPDPGRDDLGYHGIEHLAQISGAGAANRLTGPGIGLFDGVGEQLGEHADRVQRQREDAGQHPDAERPHEQHREQEIGHRPAECDDRPGRGVHDGVRGGVAGGQECQRDRDDGGQHRPQDRHQQGFDREHPDAAGVIQARWQHALQ